MDTPFLTIGFATRDDKMAAGVLAALRAQERSLSQPIEIVIIDNSKQTVEDGREVPNPYAVELEKQAKNTPNTRYIRAVGPPSSCLYKDRVFREAHGQFVLCCDSHVFFEQGALDALIGYYQQHPETSDLIMGPMLSISGKITATNQQLYASEPYPVPPNAKAYDGVVCRGNQIGLWVIDPRGTDPANPAFEIMQQGTFAFSCRREAWPGFHPAFSGFGGNETYLMEQFRSRGDKVLCLPGFRAIHSFYEPEGKPYTALLLDRVRNYLVGFLALNRMDLYEAAVSHYSTQNKAVVAQAIKDAQAINEGKVAPSKPAAAPAKKPAAPKPNPVYDAFLEKLGVKRGGTIPQSLFELLQRTPATVKTLEFGSGVSTLILDSIGCDHTAVEHSQEWIDRVKPLLTHETTKLIHAPLTGDPPWYGWTPAYGELFNLILIDGPPGNAAKDPGRLGAIGRVDKMLAPGGTIIIDDTHREAEKQIANALVKSLGLKAFIFRDGERSFHVLSAPEEPLGEGPGTELVNEFDGHGFPKCQQCIALARKMNQWGVDGCRERIDEIVSDILPRAKNWLAAKKPWAQKLLGAVGAEDKALSWKIRQHVEAAIEAAAKVQSTVA